MGDLNTEGAAVVSRDVATEWFVSVQDGKQRLDNGVIKTVAGEDTLAIIELNSGQVNVRTEIAVPASVIGPPTSVAVTPDGTLALVSSGYRRNSADPTRTVENDVLSVVDLSSQPLRIIDTLKVGKAPCGVSVSPDGKLALVANHNDGSVSVLSIARQKVAVIDQLTVGDAKCGPMHAAFTPDGKRALLTREGDHRVTLLAINGMQVTLSQRDMYPGQRPDCIDVRPQGDLAVVANIGKGQGDCDTLSLIDLSVEPPRVVDTVSVGQTPEGVFFSPDGGYVGCNVMNGSNKPNDSPFYHPNGQFVLLKVAGNKLQHLASAPIGSWSQGLAFSADGRTVLVQNTAERQIQVFSIDGEQLYDTGQRLQLNAAPVAMRRIEAGFGEKL